MSTEESRRLCSDKERVFAENYVLTLRKDKAAIAAGYSEHTASNQGCQLYARENVKSYISALLSDNSISAAETLQLISDTANANLTDYFTTTQVTHVPQVKKGLQQIIDQLQYEIDIDTEFLSLAPNLTKEERESFQSRIRSKELEIIRFDVELNKNPLAYRIVDGDPQIIDRVDLDLKKIKEDKRYGKVKSFKHTKDGIQVEMYAADAAQDRMARVHGLYEKDNEQSKPVTAIPSINVYNQAPPLAGSEKEIDV
jgi:phage terminase small subunit